MPTGYTADVCDGKVTDFPTFALKCARAFGALIMLRDEPMDAPIPDKLADGNLNYERKSVIDAEKALADWVQYPLERRIEIVREERKGDVRGVENYAVHCLAENNRIYTMLAKVRVWTPPTPEHESMKKFMIEQLTTSLHDEDYVKRRVHDAQTAAADEQDIKDAVDRRTTVLEGFVMRAKRMLAEAEARNAGRQGWIDALRDSLKQVPV